MQNILLTSVAAMLFIFGACSTQPSEDDLSNVDMVECPSLIQALSDENLEALKVIMDPLLLDTNLLDIDNDSCPYDRRLNGIVGILEDNCEVIKGSVLCCECIETFPTISEISIEYELDGVQESKILDLLSPDEQDQPLRLEGIH